MEVMPQKILMGSARQPVATNAVEECLSSCLDSMQKYGFQCHSAMFFPDKRDCILNTETGRNRADLLLNEDKSDVLYFENYYAASSCPSDTVTQYVETRNKQLTSTIPISDQSLQSCEYFCTNKIGKNGPFNCKSFMYRESDRTCFLADDLSLPSGKSRLMDAPGIDYYEKHCFKSKNVVDQTPIFENHPQKVLLGSAASVIENVPSAQKCLDLCTSPPAGLDKSFQCKSVMYYYNSRNCVLNTKSRSELPENFVDETEGATVDYFDMLPHSTAEQCPEGSKAMSLRITDSKLESDENSVVGAASGSASNCFQKCQAHSPEKCRNFNYNKGTAKCDFMFVQSHKLSNLQTDANADYYQVACVPSQSPCEHAYDVTVAKEAIGRVQEVKRIPVSRPDCLSMCLDDSKCKGINYNHEIGSCAKVLGNPQSYSANPACNYYSKVCGVASGYTPGTVGVQTVCNLDGMKILVTKEESFTGSVFAKMKYDTCRVEVKESKTAMLYLGYPVARAESPFGVMPQPCVGHKCAAAKKQKRQRRQGFGQPTAMVPMQPQMFSQLLPAPTIPVHDCGITDLRNGTFRATVVVQANSLGIPGLVTSMDEVYEVACDYTSIASSNAVVRKGLHVEGPTPTIINPRGKVTLTSPIMLQLGGHGQSVLRARLGEMLELKWQMMVPGLNLDFFVQTCVAERGDFFQPIVAPSTAYSAPMCATPPCPAVPMLCTAPSCTANAFTKTAQLLLIENGCPAPAVAGRIMPEPIRKVDAVTKMTLMQAFRFDGSPTVRIQCRLKICEGSCPAVACNIPGHTAKKSKQKREVEINEVNIFNDTDKIETEYYTIPVMTSAITTFAIEDPSQEVMVPKSSNMQKNVPSAPEIRPHVQIRKLEKNKLCFPKSTFVGISSFLCILALMQAAAVAMIVTKHCRRKGI
ncbi:unnamed protein product [Soboliphyme baturini]|uniref:PAN domain protein n=1 Tax=Soboliphyme baturini TaxID=241478 RepID=A0A183IBD8_9BILA|nr:unnamed protein product [Soboliphyme baturini]